MDIDTDEIQHIVIEPHEPQEQQEVQADDTQSDGMHVADVHPLLRTNPRSTISRDLDGWFYPIAFAAGVLLGFVVVAGGYTVYNHIGKSQQ